MPRVEVTDAVSPFHGGELAIQEKLGVREKVQKYATKMVRPYMPDQHREFFAELRYFFLGSVDEAGMPWAHMVWGDPGFIGSPDPEHLTLPLACVPAEARHVGAEVGGLGLMLQARRRNRVNGRVAHVGTDRLTLKVTQSFGNCPQYIQAREPDAVAPRLSAGAVQTALNAAHRALIERADTFFIASASSQLGADACHGVDVSHRGGPPGFVKFLDERTLLFPDFSGNRHFNTLGNIHDTGRAGLLFLDFENGDLMQISGTAAIVWPEDSPFAYTAAERFVQVSVDQVKVTPAAVPFTWHFHGNSPRLPESAGWTERTGQGDVS